MAHLSLPQLTYHKQSFPNLQPLAKNFGAFWDDGVFFRQIFKVNIRFWKNANLASFSTATSSEPRARFFKYFHNITHVNR